MLNFKRTQKSLLMVNTLRIVLELFTSTFLTSYIVSLSPNNIFGSAVINIALFYISWYAVFIFLDLFVSYIVDKSNRVSLLRIGIIISAILLVAIVFWGEALSKWIILAGALCGISDAFYYSSYFVMKNELNGRVSIKEYNLLATICENLVRIIVPTILGYIIDVSTFSRIAIYIVIITLIQFGLTFLIKSNRPENSKFELKKYFKYLRTNKDDFNKIKYTYLNAFLAGFKTTYKVIIVILTIYTFKTNLSLGFYTSIFSVATITLLLLYKKSEDKPKIKKLPIYLTVGIVPFIGCIVVILWMNIYTLIIYNFLLTIAIYFSEYLGSAERDAIIKNLNQYEFIAEHQFVTELVQCSTRIISYVLFIIAGLFANITVFKILMLLLILTNPLKYLVMYKQRQVRHELEKNQNK